MDPLQEAARHLTQRRPEAALQVLEAALRQRPGFPPLVSMAAVALSELRRFEEALRMAAQAVQAAPAWPDGHVNLGYAQEAAGDAAEAEASLRQALALQPAHAVAALNLANLLLRQGRAEETLALLQPALDAAPENAPLLLRRADALQALRQDEEALVLYRRLAPRPGGAEAANKAAALLFERGQPAEALVLLDAALARAPEHPRLHNNRGTALRQLKRPAEAAEAYRRSAALAPRRPEAWRNLGLLTAEQGETEAARAAFAEVLRLAPQDATARHMLDALEGRTTAAPPEGFVARSFDAFAPTFEKRLVETLGYRAPWDLARLLTEVAERPRIGRALDLGCGTGLVAEAVDAALAQAGGTTVEVWTGVDLSPRMLEQAAAKGRYARLEEAEILAFLAATPERFDLVAAADVLIYLGEVGPLLSGIARVLRPGGHALLSTERLEQGRVQLRPSGRYAQSDRHMEEQIAEAGLVLAMTAPAVLRQENGRPVEGTLFCCRQEV